MKAMAASGPRGGDQRRRVVVLVEFHYLAVAKCPEIRLRRVADLARLSIPPRGRPSHGDVVALRDEVVGLVMDHLPVGEQPLEVPLEVLLGLDGRGELRLRRPGGQGETPDVIHHEIEPGLDAPPLALVPFTIRSLQLRDVIRGRSHGVTSRSGRRQSGHEPASGRDPTTRPRLALDLAREYSRPETQEGPPMRSLRFSAFALCVLVL